MLRFLFGGCANMAGSGCEYIECGVLMYIKFILCFTNFISLLFHHNHSDALHLKYQKAINKLALNSFNFFANANLLFRG